MPSQYNRGSKDDWEALQMILAKNPSLKQRVIGRLKAIRALNIERKIENKKKLTQKK